MGFGASTRLFRATKCQAGVYASVAVRHPEAAVIVPPRATAVPSVRHGRDSTHPARPPPPAYRRAWAHGLAESVRVHEAGPSRSHDGQVEAGDRRRAARACGRGAPCDRGGRGCSCARPHAGAGTPELRPHRLSPDGGGATASTRLIGAPRWREPHRDTSREVVGRSDWGSVPESRADDLQETDPPRDAGEIA